MLIMTLAQVKLNRLTHFPEASALTSFKLTGPCLWGRNPGVKLRRTILNDCIVKTLTLRHFDHQYNVLDKWAQYLVSNAINPGNQYVVDLCSLSSPTLNKYNRDFTDSPLTGPVVNDTNLALKGILGIQVGSFAIFPSLSTVQFGLGHGWHSKRHE
jgi:Glutaminase A six helical-hairpin domain